MLSFVHFSFLFRPTSRRESIRCEHDKHTRHSFKLGIEFILRFTFEFETTARYTWDMKSGQRIIRKRIECLTMETSYCTAKMLSFDAKWCVRTCVCQRTIETHYWLRLFKFIFSVIIFVALQNARRHWRIVPNFNLSKILCLRSRSNDD